MASAIRGIAGPIYWRLRRRALQAWFAVSRPDRVHLLGGRTMYLDRADQRSFALWLSGGNVNPRSMALWRSLLRLRPWSLVLDVGANHGEMLLLPNLPAGARVYGFEPNAALVPLLRRSLAESGVAAEVVETAVGDADGHVTLHIDLRWSGTSSIIAANTSGTHRAMEVPITRLDTFIGGLAGLPPGGDLLVKIDVEGQEWPVLQGLLPALDRFEHVAIMAEIHRLDPAAFDAICAAFDVATPDADGALMLHSAPKLADLPGMDVVLLPKRSASPGGVAGPPAVRPA